MDEVQADFMIRLHDDARRIVTRRVNRSWMRVLHGFGIDIGVIEAAYDLVCAGNRYEEVKGHGARS